MSALLTTGLRIEIQPNDVTGIRNIFLGSHYHTSLPTGLPQSVAS